MAAMARFLVHVAGCVGDEYNGWFSLSSACA